MKKFISLCIIIFVLYILAVFQFPEISDSFGFKKYNDIIRNFKGGLDTTVTDIPSAEQAKQAFSGAKNLKETFLDGLDTTKNKIDSIRETASGAEATYNKTVETITTVKKTVDGISDTLNDIQAVREGIVNSVNTDNVDIAVTNK